MDTSKAGTPKAATPRAAAPADPATTAEQLAKNFYDSATAFRDSTIGMSDADAVPILAKANALEEQGDGFTAQAVAAILAPIQANLAGIEAVTQQANAQVGKLKTVAEIVSVAILVLAVGTAAAAGDPAAIIKAVQALADSVSGTAAPASASAPAAGKS